jgi:serine/threonine-protein kinase HipA
LCDVAALLGIRNDASVSPHKRRPVPVYDERNNNTASLALAMNVAEYFDLDTNKARAMAAQVGKTVSKWRHEAVRHGLTRTEVDRMASAFEHEDLKMASGGR